MTDYLSRCFVLLHFVLSPCEGLASLGGSCSRHCMSLVTQSPQSLPGPRQFHGVPRSFLTLIVLKTGRIFCGLSHWLTRSDIFSWWDLSYKKVVFSELHNLVLCRLVMPVYFNLSSLKFLQTRTFSVMCLLGLILLFLLTWKSIKISLRWMQSLKFGEYRGQKGNFWSSGRSSYFTDWVMR